MCWRTVSTHTKNETRSTSLSTKINSEGVKHLNKWPKTLKLLGKNRKKVLPDFGKGKDFSENSNNVGKDAKNWLLKLHGIINVLNNEGNNCQREPYYTTHWTWRNLLRVLHLWTSCSRRYSTHYQRRKVNNNPVTYSFVYNGVLSARYHGRTVHKT